MSEPPSSLPVTGAFEEHFTAAREFTLDETAVVVGEVGAFLELADKTIAVGDAFAHRVLRYGSQGELLATAGGKGEGPGEFMALSGIVEMSDGTILVVDQQLSRGTLLSPDLTLDSTMMILPRPTGSVVRSGDAVVFNVRTGRRQAGLMVWRGLGDIAAMGDAPTPESAIGMPYWDGFSTRHLAGTEGVIISAYGLTYPIHLLDRNLDLEWVLNSPPPGHRPPPAVERGEFAGSGAQTRLREWMESFDLITGLFVMRTNLLGVVHGVMSMNHTTGRIHRTHERLDIYDLPTRRKIAENIRLPTDSRVLGGGRDGFYLLVGNPPSDWRIVEAQPRRSN